MDSYRDNRAPTVIWSLRDLNEGSPGYVRTSDHDTIEVLRNLGDGTCNVQVWSRRDARLLAKRINQCLDSTVKP